MIYYTPDNKYEILLAMRTIINVHPPGYGRRLQMSKYLREMPPFNGDFHRGLGYPDLVSLR